MGGYSTETNTYKRIRYLNAIRKFLMSEKATPGNDGQSYLADQGKVVLSTKTDLVFSRGPVLVVLNNVGRHYHDHKFTLMPAPVSQRASGDSAVTLDVSSSGFQGDLVE
jgi:hypothetical protein